MNINGDRLIAKTKDYLDSTLGLILGGELNGSRPPQLPYYLKAGTQFVECEINGHKYMMVIPGHKPDGSTLVKRLEEIAQRTNLPTILVLENIDVVRRRVLISNRMEFVVPGKQLYLPSIGAAFKERGLEKVCYVEKDRFSPSAQVLLLFHLQRMPIDGKTLTQIAKQFTYNVKTIAEAAKELERVGICSIEGNNGGKFLHFIPKEEIWDKAYPLFSNPIHKVLYCNDIDQIPKDILFVTYDSALSHYTFMADFAEESFAVNKNDEIIKKLKKNGKLNPIEGRYRIELWKYAPSLLAKDNVVDPLSLALTYKDCDDERVISEINDLVKRICKD